MKQKALKMALIAGLGVTSLTGCMGQMAATGLVNKFNLEVVDNRYAREGLFLLCSIPSITLEKPSNPLLFQVFEKSPVLMNADKYRCLMTAVAILSPFVVARY